MALAFLGSDSDEISDDLAIFSPNPQNLPSLVDRFPSFDILVLNSNDCSASCLTDAFRGGGRGKMSRLCGFSIPFKVSAPESGSHHEGFGLCVPSHNDENNPFGFKEACNLIGRDRMVNVMDCESQLELSTSWRLDKFVSKCFGVDFGDSTPQNTPKKKKKKTPSRKSPRNSPRDNLKKKKDVDPDYDSDDMLLSTMRDNVKKRKKSVRKAVDPDYDSDDILLSTMLDDAANKRVNGTQNRGKLKPKPKPKPKPKVPSSFSKLSSANFPPDWKVQELSGGHYHITAPNEVMYKNKRDALKALREGEGYGGPNVQPNNNAYKSPKEATEELAPLSHGMGPLNVISLEITNDSPKMLALVKSPAFVRDIDWIDKCWPAYREGRRDNLYCNDTGSGRDWLKNPHSGDLVQHEFDKPATQHYCLMSQAGSFTDFHADFGGTSVWYNVVKGRKVFFLVEPSEKNLQAYESWICKDGQRSFFGDKKLTGGGCKVAVVEAGETLIVPGGWLHAVYTPIDSLVFGGNYLHNFGIKMQININSIEIRRRVEEQYRFPMFVQINFYAAGKLLMDLRSGDGDAVLGEKEREGGFFLCKACRSWNRPQNGGQLIKGSTQWGAEDSARIAGCGSVEEMLNELEKLLALDGNPKTL